MVNLKKERFFLATIFFFFKCVFFNFLRKANEFRSKVIMDVGLPYEVPQEIFDLYKKNKKEGVAKLLGEIETVCLIRLFKNFQVYLKEVEQLPNYGTFLF